MTFYSKMDTKYKKFLVFLVVIVGLSCFFPFPFTNIEFDWIAFGILGGLFIILSGMMIWSHTSIRYEFKEDHLYIHGGIFRFDIPYNKITSLTRTNDYLTGMRVMSSSKGLAIYNSHSPFGEIKISPDPEEEFIQTLKKHAPQVQIRL
ncbi:PH domain-containing protein [Bacillus sp. B-jedd]|uniref:PH domain-containing protein n=1 Tax=Bacillus sp. B-jedd TaxID=1476857 RepID=UPI00051563C0|nr:PH domain-containing protein [Bacillus sp. B-jedd]CEG26264.1 putative integral inner membrane protein [Bacillus sp. B-jedd]